jgi:hypothetical protein
LPIPEVVKEEVHTAAYLNIVKVFEPLEGGLTTLTMIVEARSLKK